jgi:hypothetical protein
MDIPFRCAASWVPGVLRLEWWYTTNPNESEWRVPWTFDNETKDTIIQVRPLMMKPTTRFIVNKSFNEEIKKSSPTQSSSLLFNSMQCTLLVRVVSSYHSFMDVAGRWMILSNDNESENTSVFATIVLWDSIVVHGTILSRSILYVLVAAGPIT